jgi:hypothetical protein
VSIAFLNACVGLLSGAMIMVVRRSSLKYGRRLGYYLYQNIAQAGRFFHAPLNFRSPSRNNAEQVIGFCSLVMYLIEVLSNKRKAAINTKISAIIGHKSKSTKWYPFATFDILVP